MISIRFIFSHLQIISGQKFVKTALCLKIGTKGMFVSIRPYCSMGCEEWRMVEKQ